MPIQYIAINDGNGSSTAAAAATASNPSDYKKSGARPKDSNPIAKTDGKAGPSEQTDHGVYFVAFVNIFDAFI